MKHVYALYESESDGRERSRWVRVGVAFDNRDGSLNVLLDAIPLTGRLQIRARGDSDEPGKPSDTAILDSIVESFPGLADGATSVNGADLVSMLTRFIMGRRSK